MSRGGPLRVDPAAYSADQRARGSTLRSESEKGRARRLRWEAARRRYLDALAKSQGREGLPPVCIVCGVRPVVDVHHRRGRVGDLMWDERHFAGVCRGCHEKEHGIG